MSVPGGGDEVRPGVFICYRREDSPNSALRVYRLLSERFGDDRVFMDVAIPAAVDFVEWIEDSIGAAGVVVAIIGRRWLEADAAGRRRVDEEDDFVRNELAGALESAIAVLPVLVDGATMPARKELPAELARLPAINAHELRSDAYWRDSDEKLVARVEHMVGATPTKPRMVPPPRLPGSVLALGLAGLLLVAAALGPLWTTYVAPSFRYLPVAPGVFTAAAPLGLLAGASLLGFRLLAVRRAGWLDVGLLLGFGIEAGAKGVSLLGSASGRVQAGGLVLAAGGALLVAAGAAAASHVSRRSPAAAREEPTHGVLAFVAALGAAMMVVAAFVPFNVANPGGNRVVAEDSWLGVDPIVTGLAVLGGVAVLLAGRRRLAAGLLIALGLCASLLWARYVGIPVAQWLDTDDVASPQAGGFLGLAGGLVVLGAGWRLAVVGPAEVPAAEPLPTT